MKKFIFVALCCATIQHYCCAQRLPAGDHHAAASSAKPDRHDKHNGKTALHYAARVGDLRVIERLLTDPTFNGDHRVNAQDGDGYTPLHYAAAGDHHDVVSYLLARGADPTIKTSLGKTALDLAKESRASTSIDLLTPGQSS